MKQNAEAYRKQMEGDDQTNHVLIFRQTFCMSKIHCYVVSVDLRRIKRNLWETWGHMWKKRGTSWSRCNTLQWKLQRFQIWWSQNFIAWKYIVCWVAKNQQKSCNIKNEMQDRFWKNFWYCLVTLKCQMLVLLLKETARSMFFRKDFYHS